MVVIANLDSYTIQQTNMAIEHGLFLVGLPVKNCDFPHLC